jgi:hypothetical protein
MATILIFVYLMIGFQIAIVILVEGDIWDSYGVYIGMFLAFAFIWPIVLAVYNYEFIKREIKDQLSRPKHRNEK